MNQMFEEYRTLVLHRSNCFLPFCYTYFRRTPSGFGESRCSKPQQLLCFVNPQPKRLGRQFLKQKTSTSVASLKKGFKLVLDVAYASFRHFASQSEPQNGKLSPPLLRKVSENFRSLCVAKGAKACREAGQARTTFRFAELLIGHFFGVFGKTKVWLFLRRKPELGFGLLRPQTADRRSAVCGNLNVLPLAVVSKDRKFCLTLCSALLLSTSLAKGKVRRWPDDQSNEPADSAVCSAILAEHKYLICASTTSSVRFLPKKLRIKSKYSNRVGFLNFLGRCGVSATPKGNSKTGVKCTKNYRNGAPLAIGFRVYTRTELFSNSFKSKYEQSRTFGPNFRVLKNTTGQFILSSYVTPTFSATLRKQQGLPIRELKLREIAPTEFRLPSWEVKSSQNNQKMLFCEFAALRSTASSSNTFKPQIWVVPELRNTGVALTDRRSVVRGCPKTAFRCFCLTLLSKVSKSTRKLGAERLEVKTSLNSRRTFSPHFVCEDRCGVSVTLRSKVAPVGGENPRATFSLFLSPLGLGSLSARTFANRRPSVGESYARVTAPLLTLLSKVDKLTSRRSVTGTTFWSRKLSLGSTSTCFAQKFSVAKANRGVTLLRKVAAPEFCILCFTKWPPSGVISKCFCLSSKSYARAEEKPKIRHRFTVWGVGIDTKYCQAKLLGSRKSALSTLLGHPKRRLALSSPALCNKTKTRYKIIRPLLHFSRENLTILCNNLRLPVYPDKSNKAVQYSRNRLREQIIPAIKLFLNPKIDDALFKLAELLTQDLSLVSDLVDTGRRSRTLFALSAPTNSQFAHFATQSEQRGRNCGAAILRRCSKPTLRLDKAFPKSIGFL